MNPNSTIAEEEDGWFGDGSAFDSGEDLAAALMELAGVATQKLVTHARVVEVEDRGPRDMTFELLRPHQPEPERHVIATVRSRSWSPADQPLTWSVRSPGAEEVPSRQPGKTGWSIRSSVQMLQRTEEVMLKVREEAVSAALVAAARAFTSSR